METKKGFFTKIGQVLDEQLARMRQTATKTQPRPGRIKRLLRWMVPNGGTLLLVILLVATARVWAAPLQNALNAPGPSATTINYQGRLANTAGTPLDGTYGMSFAVYDAATAGNLIWGPEQHTAVEVSEGLFSIGLGSQTSGGIPTTTWNGDRYLEITVDGETLEPRELIRSVPIAGMALTVPDGAITASKLAPEAIGTAQNTSVHHSGTVTMIGTAEDDVLIFPDTEVTIQVPAPSRILMVAGGGLTIFAGNGELYAGICVDGVMQGRIQNYTPDITTINYEKWNWVNIHAVDTGLHTFSLCARGSSGIEARWFMPTISLVAIPGQ